MLQAFALAFRQLGDRRLVGLFATSLAVTLAVFAALGVALWFALDAVAGRYLARADAPGLVTLLSLVAGLALLWIAFRAVAIAVVGLFGDQVVHAVEARHYPAALGMARPVPFARSLLMGLHSIARLVGYNLLATPLYIVTLATGVGLPLAFFAINGWLLGRDLGDMVAVRHVPRAELSAWRRKTRWRRAGVGLLTGGLFVVPVVNFIAPVIGAAAMTHLFHRRRA